MRNHRRHSGFSRLRRKVHRRFTDILEHSPYCPFYGTLGLLFLFSLFYAGGGHWWLPSALACTFLLLGFWLLDFWWRDDSRLNIRFHAGLLLFLLPLVAGLIQLLPIGRLVCLLCRQPGRVGLLFMNSVCGSACTADDGSGCDLVQMRIVAACLLVFSAL